MRSLATVLGFFFNLRLLNVTLSFFQPYIAGNPDEHFMGYEDLIFIPVTRRVKGYSRFVGKYVTGRNNLFRLHKVYIL